MQGRFLGWIKGFYDAKQVETEKTKRADKHTGMMEVIREVRESYLPDIRAEMAAITDDAEKLQHFLYVDDLISFAIMLTVIDELRTLYQGKIFERVKMLTQDNDDTRIYIAEVNQATKPFDLFLNANTIDTITFDSVNEFISDQCNAVCTRLATAFGFNINDISEQFNIEFKRNVESDIALVFISHIFKQSDMRQTAGVAAMTKEFFWLTARKVLHPYASMPHLISCLEPHAEMVGIFRELNAWMKGVHFYHASLLKRELQLKEIEHSLTEDGVILLAEDKAYPPINSIVDKAMQMRFGLTFYDLARYVHDASEVLHSRLHPANSENTASGPSKIGLFAESSSEAAAILPVGSASKDSRDSFNPA